jgi:hypothetical protein
VSNIESTTEDTAEPEDEQGQEYSISFQDQVHPHKIPFSERASEKDLLMTVVEFLIACVN